MFKSLLDLIYPVGSYYITNSNNNPTDIFGGSWIKIPDGYTIRQFESGHDINTNAGSNSFTLGEANMPKHAHTVPEHTHGISVSTNSAGDHSHSMANNSCTSAVGNISDCVRYKVSIASGAIATGTRHWAMTSTNSDQTKSFGWISSTVNAGGHTHGVNVTFNKKEAFNTTEKGSTSAYGYTTSSHYCAIWYRSE